MPSLEDLSGLLRGRRRPDPAELEVYARAITPLVERLGALFVRWRRDLEIDAPADDLADAASIQRWEAAGLRDALGEITPPPALTRLHADLLEVTADTVRATQLVSNGYRFHSSNARCDGHALMLAAEERHTALRQALDRQGISVATVDAEGSR